MALCGMLGLFAVMWVSSASAQQGNTPGVRREILTDDPFFQRKALTGNWWGARNALNEKGIVFNLAYTSVWQVNTRGGISTHRRNGRFEGSYDAELGMTWDQLIGIPLGKTFAHVEGEYSDGINDTCVGSITWCNGDAVGVTGGDITELWHEVDLFDSRFRVRFGKVDLTGGFNCHGASVSFDSNLYANDEKVQFLNNALVNNPTIPFPSPDNTIGAMVFWEPIERFYVSAGMGDIDSNGTYFGLTQTIQRGFCGPYNYLHLFETGYIPEFKSSRGPLLGAYRLGVWMQAGETNYLDGGSRYKRDDVGFYLSFDQALCQESAEPDDTQGLGVFFRWGVCDRDVNGVYAHWSVGAQYQGLLPGRDNDVLAAAIADSHASPLAGYTASHEFLAEFYYSIALTPWCALTGDLQLIGHPGANADAGTAVVIALRFQVTF